MVQSDGATKDQQTSTEALIQLDATAFIFFSSVFPQILGHRPLTSNCFEFHFTEEPHSGNLSQNDVQGNLLDHCLIAWVRSHHPRRD